MTNTQKFRAELQRIVDLLKTGQIELAITKLELRIGEITLLANEDRRKDQYVDLLQRDLGVAKANANLCSSFSYDEYKAMVKFFKDWREARGQDCAESVRIINERLGKK